MFFQSIYAQYTLSGVSAVNIDLFMNTNAEHDATYIGSQVVTEGVNAFAVKPMDVMTDKFSEGNGRPTFAATITGVDDQNAYYLLDFTASHTLVWNTNCQQTGLGNYAAGSCELNPTLLSTSFDSANNSTGLLRETGTFTDAKFGGYVVSGTKYTSQMCFASGFCKLIQIYSGETVTADNWNFNSDGGYGVIGMSPQSNFWTGFVNSETYKAQYSIALARVTPLSVHATPKVGSSVASNITFGAAADDYYLGMTSMNVSALANYSYALSNISFGIVYQENGVDSSEYFFDLGVPTNPVTFTTNFEGLGLPAALYSQVAELLVDISSNTVVCDSTLDGICVMPEECSAYTAFEDYTFKFKFVGADNYIRVPLGTFAQNVKGSGGVAVCNIDITYLDPLATQSNNIIFGGLFFQEFFGEFTNSYNVDPVT